MEKKIKVDNIKLAEIREFSTEHNGVATDFYSYLFLIEKDGFYLNPFEINEILPIYERIPYCNCTMDGEAFGSKIKLAQGVEKDGPCIVLTTDDFSTFTDMKEFSLKQLENIVLSSEYYFKDRESIVNDRFKYNPIMKNKYKKQDKAAKEKLDQLFEQYEDKKLLRK